MKRKSKFGVPPGTLIYTGSKSESFELELIHYSPNDFEKSSPSTIEELKNHLKADGVNWINIIGLHEVDSIRKIGQLFEVHPLVMEDILNVNQRPKIDIMDDYLFIVLKMIGYQSDMAELDVEQVSIIIKDNTIFTFQERKGDLFGPVRDRLESNKGIIRKNKADYLLYSLIDIVVDHYFLVLEEMVIKVEDLEELVLSEPSSEAVHLIYHLKKQLIELRKSVWPLREIISTLYKGDIKFITRKTTVYFRDVYDHTIQVIDTIETLRDTLSGLLDIYLSSVSNRMNEVMKVLTVISTTFIPITFIAGVYGMNFEYMPELKWHYGYFAVLAVMLIIAIGMLFFFKRKKWL